MDRSGSTNGGSATFLWRRALPAVITGVGAFAVLPTGSAAALPPGCNQSGQTVTCTVIYTSGSNPFTVPAGASAIHVVALGRKRGALFAGGGAGPPLL